LFLYVEKESTLGILSKLSRY